MTSMQQHGESERHGDSFELEQKHKPKKDGTTTPDHSGSSDETGVDAAPKDEVDEEEANREYPGTASVAVIMVSIYMAMFLVSIDRTIVATAIPQLTDQFHSIGDIGWYASAYALTGCAVQLSIGRVYTFYPSKWVFLAVIVLFEIGSAVCAGAHNSATVIAGRAIQGMGCAGVFSGSMILMVENVPLHKRPIYMGFLMAIMSISAIIGPLIGGALTSNLGWRWCFIINLPIGAVTILVMLFIVKASPAKKQGEQLKEKIMQLDPIGATFLIPSVTCLILALQWGGAQYAWGSWRIILLLVLSGVLGIVFIAVQITMPHTATIPPRIIKQRTVAASFYYSICVGGAMMTIVYWIPTWFQAIKNATPLKSGEMTIPLLVSQSLGSISSGILVSQVVGYATPFMILSSCLMAVGAGLLSTFTVATDHQMWIGYQVLFGFGLGLGMQQGSTAIQTVLKKDDIPSAVSLIFFGQQLGGSICICIGQNVFNQQIIKGLTKANLAMDPSAIFQTGATEIKNLAHTAAEKAALLVVYNDALANVFYVAVGIAAISIFGAMCVEWKSVKGLKPAH